MYILQAALYAIVGLAAAVGAVRGGRKVFLWQRNRR